MSILNVENKARRVDFAGLRSLLARFVIFQYILVAEFARYGCSEALSHNPVLE